MKTNIMTTQNEPLEERLQREAIRILEEELEVDCQEYTPDQGMPPTIYELNHSQLDYLVSKLVAETLKAAVSAIEEKAESGYLAHSYKAVGREGKFIPLPTAITAVEGVGKNE